ncbi:MAG TPA: helix-turn-helix transcriptional regulator [Mycobacteriales bacterium]|nr:helix-turn-helix transcriptional regulator [Mycobacteriales bacterium]
MGPATRSAELVRTARTRAGLTQAELGARAGITQSVVSAYESSRRQPAFPMLAHLCAAAGFRMFVDVVPLGPAGFREEEDQLDALRRRRGAVLDTVGRFGGTDVRVLLGEVGQLDVLVDLPPDAGPHTRAAVERALTGLLGARVALVRLEDLTPGVRALVERAALPI